MHILSLQRLLLMILFAVTGQTLVAQSPQQKQDSIVDQIKGSVFSFYADPIFYRDSIAPAKIRSGAQQRFGETGEQVVLNMLAMRYFLRMEKEFSREDFKQWMELKIALHQKYPDFLQNDMDLNNDAWWVFTHSEDKKDLQHALQWSKKAITKAPQSGNWLDTYANLLYKLGRNKEAIATQEKALSLEPENEEIKTNLAKMKRLEKTWPQ